MPAARLQSDGTAIWPALWTGPAHRMEFEVNGLGGKDMSGEKKVKRQVEGKKQGWVFFLHCPGIWAC